MHTTREKYDNYKDVQNAQMYKLQKCTTTMPKDKITKSTNISIV